MTNQHVFIADLEDGCPAAAGWVDYFDHLIPTMMGSHTTAYLLGRPRPVCAVQRYATLEFARSIHCPSMGLLRRPTPGEIVEADDCAGPAGRARIRAQLDKTQVAAAPSLRTLPQES